METTRPTGVKEEKRIQRGNAEAVLFVGDLQKIGKVMGNVLYAISNKVEDLVASNQKKADFDK